MQARSQQQATSLSPPFESQLKRGGARKYIVGVPYSHMGSLVSKYLDIWIFGYLDEVQFGYMNANSVERVPLLSQNNIM
jgi:hypothetical protein